MASGAAVRSVLEASASATGAAVVVAASGYLAALFPRDSPMLQAPAVGQVSRLTMNVWLPCLTFASLAAGVDGPTLARFWVLPVAGFVTTAVSYVVADVAQWLLRPDPALRTALRVAISHPNAFSYPLLLLKSLCEHRTVNDEFGGDEVECTRVATSMLNVYLAAWHLFYWGYGFPSLGREQKLPDRPSTDPPQRSDVDDRGGGQGTPSGLQHQAWGDKSGVAQAQAGEPPCAGIERDSPARTPAGPSVEMRACRPDAGGDGIAAESPSPQASPAIRRHTPAWGPMWRSLGQFLYTTLTQPNILGLIGGIFVAVTPLKPLMFQVNPPRALRPLGAALETLGEPMVAASTMITAAVLANGRKRTASLRLDSCTRLVSSTSGSESRWSHVSRSLSAQMPSRLVVRTCVWFVASRLVVIPLLGYSLVAAALSAGLRLPSSGMITLVMLMQLAMPGAQTILASLNVVDRGNVAEDIAPYYLVQYVASIVTLTGFTSWALLIIYGH